MSNSPDETLSSVVKPQVPPFFSIKILNVRVDLLTRRDFKELLIYYLRIKKRGGLSYINIHTINIAQKLPWVKKFKDQSILSYCYGNGIRLGARFLVFPLEWYKKFPLALAKSFACRIPGMRKKLIY